MNASMSGASPTRRRIQQSSEDRMPAWDSIFPGLEAEPGTERLQAQHKALWERIRKRGTQMTIAEEKELNCLFLAIFPKVLQDRPLDLEDIETEFEDDDDPLSDVVLNGVEKGPSMSVIGSRFKKAAGWPPLVYVALGLALSAVWALGTSVQVLTSEAWIMHKSMNQIGFTAFGQLFDACSGNLAPDMWIPFTFGWGVQFALIVASIGIELPRDPEWRYWLAWGAILGLIAVNSCGDFSSSASYGFWGQCGFTLVVFFVTFCMGLFAIMAFKHAWEVMKASR